MTQQSGTASISPMPSPTRHWPFTVEAWRRLDAELVELAVEVDELARQSSSEDGLASRAPGTVSGPAVRARTRLDMLRKVLADAESTKMTTVGWSSGGA